MIQSGHEALSRIVRKMTTKNNVAAITYRTRVDAEKDVESILDIFNIVCLFVYFMQFLHSKVQQMGPNPDVTPWSLEHFGLRCPELVIHFC